jgi:hypothetical protein
VLAPIGLRLEAEDPDKVKEIERLKLEQKKLEKELAEKRKQAQPPREARGAG